MQTESRNIKVFKDETSLNHAAANLLLASAKDAVAKRGRFVIELSGGSSPNAIYEALAAPPFSAQMPWEQIFFFWGDERCVAPDDKRNNAYTAKILMLNKMPVPASHIFPVPVNLPSDAAAKTYEATINAFFKEQVFFDFVLLGLGENGHTASLFPGTPVLREKVAGIRTVFDAEGSMMRISMTAPLLNLGRQILFIVKGKRKADILKRVLEGPFLPESIPAQLIQPLKGSLNFFVDEAARPQ